MFGTIFTMKPKSGQEAAVVELFQRWDRERRPKIKGAVAGHLYRSEQNPAELMAAVVFDSRENYFANASDPEQDQWYRDLVGLLEAEPRFIDGEVLVTWPANREEWTSDELHSYGRAGPSNMST
jgi:quinol monooxygenase YgiN